MGRCDQAGAADQEKTQQQWQRGRMYHRDAINSGGEFDNRSLLVRVRV